LQGGPRKEISFCNVAPGRPASGGPAKFRPTAGRARAGEGPWVLGDRFPCSVAAGNGPARGGAGGQARWPPRLEFRWHGLNAGGMGSWGAIADAREGGEQLVLVRSRPELAARRGGLQWRHGGERGRGGARPGAMQRGSAPLWWPRIDGDVPRSKCRPREE
jgi:hypothetical protein